MIFPLKLHMKAISSQGSNVLIVGRDENGQRWVVQDTTFRAYFYVLDTEANRKTLFKRGLEYVQGPLGIDDRQTLKVFVSTPEAVGKRRRGFDFTYEADVPYTRRYLVDKGIKDGLIVRAARQIGKDMLIVTKPGDITPVDYRNPDRQFLYDIETNKPEGSNHYSPPIFARGAVTCKTVHDTFDGTNFHTFAWHPKLGQKGKPKLHVKNRFSKAFGRHVDWYVNIYGTEYEMFEAMLAFHKDRRPDVTSAWNGHLGWKKFMKKQGGFDMPYLINRANNLQKGLGSHWSPMNSAHAGFKNFGKEAKTGNFSCYVDGLQLVDSMTTMQVKDGGFVAQVPYSDLKRIVKDKLGYEMNKEIRKDIGCVAEEHLILRPDLSWTPAGDLAVGDEVASFDADLPADSYGRRFRVGKVEHNQVEELDAFDVELEDGTVVTTTPNHPWFSWSGSATRWTETQHLKSGQLVARIAKTLSRIEERDAGWLAGIFDGEGSISQHANQTGKDSYALVLTVAQRPGTVLTEIENLLQKYGFEYSRQENHNTRSLGKGDCVRIVLRGGRDENLRFLMQIRPERFMEKFDWSIIGRVEVRDRVKVVAVRPAGKRHIAKLSIDRGTYIAEGFLMHNSWWLHDFWEFAEYSFDDVDAIVGLERKESYTEWIRNIQQFVGAEDANRLFTPMSLISSLNLRLAQDQLDAVVPTSGSEGDGETDDYSAEGGFVMPPQRSGIQQNMAVLDLSAMYVNVIRSCNISWETWVPNPTDAEIDNLICVPSDLGPQFFLKPETKVGLMPLSCGYLIQWRRQYDALIEAEKDADVVKTLEKARDPAKQLVLAVFGTSLSEFFSLFRPEVGSSITGMGRHIITGVDRFLKAHGYFVQYSDTDSCFVPLKSTKKEDLVKEGQDLCKLINEWFTEMVAELGVSSHSLKIGMDTILSPFVQGTQKKQYAGMQIWKKGHWQDKPKMLVKGVPGIKGDATKITRDVTEVVMRMILTNQPLMEVVEYIRDVYESVLAGQVPIEDIVKAVGLSTHPDDDLPKKNYIHTAARRGQEMYDFAYSVGSKVSIVKLKGAEKQKVAIPEGEDIPADIPLDYDHHASRAVLKPLKGIMSWVGLEDMLEGIRHGTELTRTMVLE